MLLCRRHRSIGILRSSGGGRSGDGRARSVGFGVGVASDDLSWVTSFLRSSTLRIRRSTLVVRLVLTKFDENRSFSFVRRSNSAVYVVAASVLYLATRRNEGTDSDIESFLAHRVDES